MLGYDDHRGPLKGLYHCGSGAHPGGGVTGAPASASPRPSFSALAISLNVCDMPAILLEVCFVDSEADCVAYRDNFEEICMATTDAISGLTAADLEQAPEPEVEIMTGTCS